MERSRSSRTYSRTSNTQGDQQDDQPGRPYCAEFIKELMAMDHRGVRMVSVERFMVPLSPESNPFARASMIDSIPNARTTGIGHFVRMANKTILRHHGVVLGLSDATCLTLEFNYEGLRWDLFPAPLQPQLDIDGWQEEEREASSEIIDFCRVDAKPRILAETLERVQHQIYSIDPRSMYHCQTFADDIIDGVKKG